VGSLSFLIPRCCQTVRDFERDCYGLRSGGSDYPGAGIHDQSLPLLRAAAFSLALGDLIELPVSGVSEVEDRCAEIAAKRIGLVVLPDPFSGAHREAIVAAIGRHKIVAIYPFTYFAAAGGLISYGPDVLDPFRGAASYTGRILNGERIDELPVQQATKFEFVINLRTARAFDLTVPRLGGSSSASLTSFAMSFVVLQT